jgi:ribonuclease D
VKGVFKDVPQKEIIHVKPTYVWVDTYPALRSLAARLERETSIGVDLEADSMFHYREKVCLVQISSSTQNVLLDPLILKDIRPLVPVFKDPGVQKVFHGADYDIRSLNRDFGIEVRSLFDTQIAARFLGYRETGLASLLKDKLGIIIEKKYQKKDWSERPLPSVMLDYAARDASHLLDLARILRKELRAKGRLFWVEEECEIQSRVRPQPDNNDPLFLKFKGAGKLDSRSLAVLEAILQFRRRVAMRRDLPPFKVLTNLPVMEMAVKRPARERDLKTIKGLGRAQVKVLGRSLLKKIAEALDLPADRLPVYPKRAGKRMTPKIAERAKVLREWRERCAKRLDIEPGLVCTNAQIHHLAARNPLEPEDLEGIEGLRKWQCQVFGQEVCELLRTKA